MWVINGYRCVGVRGSKDPRKADPVLRSSERDDGDDDDDNTDDDDDDDVGLNVLRAERADVGGLKWVCHTPGSDYTGYDYPSSMRGRLGRV